VDFRAADLRLKRQRFAERDHRRLVALTERLERLGNANATWIRAVNACPDSLLRALVDVEYAVLLWPARPLVRAAAVEIRLHLAQVDVQQPERLRAVDEREHAALARDPAQLFRGKQVADRAGQMGECEHFGLRRDRLRH